MTDVLVATDADWVFDEVDAALGDAETTVHRVRTGAEVRPFVKEHEPDLVVLDLQIGNMGGIATCLDLRLEAGMGRLAEPVVLMLLDRQADVFLARRSEADGWLVKPLDSIRIRRAASTLLGGQTYFEGIGEPDTADASTESMLAGGTEAKAEPATSDA